MDKPFYLEFLETLSARYQLPDPSRTKLWAMQTGLKGQKDFEAVVQEVLPHGWRILHDLNFDHSIGKIQIDALLVSPHGIYHFEVKNLVAECEYRDGEFYNLAKGYKYQNYFAQMKRQNELLMPILESLGVDVPLVSRLVFINEEDTVVFHENMQDHYLKRWQIKPFLRRVAQQQARSTHYRPLNVDQVTLALINKSVAEFAQDTYEEQVFVQDARRGIICPHCQASIKSSEINRFAIECSRCGGYEAKERAILRTICEIGLLHYDQALNSTMVCEFIGVEGLERSARRKLLGFFKRSDQHKLKNYINPAASIDKAFPRVRFKHD